MKGVTTETGAGQWGTALSMACAYLGLDCQVYMVKCSYEQKPFRREVMRTYGAAVTPSPSDTTEVGRKILREHPGTSGSLGCAISEAVERAVQQEGYRYVLGSVLNQVLLHQTVIGLETKTALEKYDIQSDIIIGCAGGGSNLGGSDFSVCGRKIKRRKGLSDYCSGTCFLSEALPEESLPMIFVIQVWLRLCRKCIHWAIILFLLPIMQGDFAITA